MIKNKSLKIANNKIKINILINKYHITSLKYFKNNLVNPIVQLMNLRNMSFVPKHTMKI